MTSSKLHTTQKAFTLVELAVAMLVIGIILSIGYFGFNSWRERVAESELASDLNGVHAAMESARNWGSGYPNIPDGTTFNGTATETSKIFTQSRNVTLTYYEGDDASYCVDAVSTARPGVKMYLSTANGNTVPKKGSCMGSQWLVTTFAGNGTAGYVDGSLATARFTQPNSMELGSDGRLYLIDASYRLRVISSTTVSTIAGTGTWVEHESGTGTATGFVANALALDGSNNAYLPTGLIHVVQRITPAGSLTTYAGGFRSCGTGNGSGDRTSARFTVPTHVAIHKASNTLYIMDSTTIRKVNMSTGVTTTLVANIRPTISIYSYNGCGSAEIGNTGMATDSVGNLYISDRAQIVKVTPSGVMSIFVGSTTQGNVDGTGGSARFGYVADIAVDGSDNLYVADTTNHAIRKISPSGVVKTIAGTGSAGFADGSASEAQFNAPRGVAVNSDGTEIYVGDSSNYRIRKITRQ